MNIRDFYNKSIFLKNLTTLISGTAIAQLIAIGIQPVIRRLYAPEDFGAFAVYTSMIGILVTVSTFRYKLAIIPAKDEKEAFDIFQLSFLINVFFFIVIFVLTLAMPGIIVKISGFPPKYSNWLYLLPFSIFLYGNFQIINYWLIRIKAFKASASNKIVRRGSEGIIQMSFGLSKIAKGLVFGDLIGHIANNISGYYYLFKQKKDVFKFNLGSLLSVAKKYSEYPKFNLIPSLLNYSCFLLPVFIINKFYGEEITGYFDLSKMVLALPLAFMSESLFQVIFQKSSEKINNNEKLLVSTLNIVKYLILISLLVIIILYFFGSWLFVFVFGEEWKVSGEYTSILMYGYAIRFIVSPLSGIYNSLGKIRIFSFWQFFYFLGIVCLLFLKNIQIFGFLKVYMMIDVLFYLINISALIYLIIQYDHKISLKAT